MGWSSDRTRALIVAAQRHGRPVGAAT